jgi:CRISPR system Cascade subunit CasB
MSADLPDFTALKARFDSETFPNSARAELRRVIEPQAVAYCPGLYRLFPGQKPDERHMRLAFLLPCCKHAPEAPTLGAQLAKAKVNEARVLQMARAKSPMDLIQLRRLLAHVELAVNWQEFGQALWYWGERAKRKVVEAYYLAQFTPAKGDKQ